MPKLKKGQKMYVAVENMRGLSIGMVYFNDYQTVYVSPEVLEKIKGGTIDSLDYVVLSYNVGERPIEVIAKEVVQEIKRCPPGSFTEEVLNKLESTKSSNPDLVYNPHVTPTEVDKKKAFN